MSRNVRVVYGEHHPGDDRPGMVIHTPFNGEFVSDLKTGVPWGERAWNDEAKEWWVSEEYADYATDLVVHHYGETLIVHADGSEEYRDEGGTTARQERLL